MNGRPTARSLGVNTALAVYADDDEDSFCRAAGALEASTGALDGSFLEL